MKKWILLAASLSLSIVLTGCLKPNEYVCTTSTGSKVSFVPTETTTTLGAGTYNFCQKQGNVEIFALTKADCSNISIKVWLEFDRITGVLVQRFAGAGNETYNCSSK